MTGRLYGIRYQGNEVTKNTLQIDFVKFGKEADANEWLTAETDTFSTRELLSKSEAVDLADWLGVVHPDWNHEEGTTDFWGN